MTFELTVANGAVSSSTPVQVRTLNVDMSLLRSHRPSSAAAGGQIHGGTAGGAVAEGGGGGVMTMVGTTTVGPYNASGSDGIGLTLGGGGGIVGVGHGSRSGGGGGGMTMMTATATTATGGMLLMEGAPVQTVGGESMIGGGVGEDDGDIPSAGATSTTATAGMTAPGGSGGSDGIDSAAQASDSTNTAAAGGVVAIPGPPDVEAALQDVASLMREVEHTLEDVRMMTVENAILMDSLALVGADV